MAQQQQVLQTSLSLLWPLLAAWTAAHADLACCRLALLLLLPLLLTEHAVQDLSLQHAAAAQIAAQIAGRPSHS
jgi:hypothetical protein